jgi:hypothetical protein
VCERQRERVIKTDTVDTQFPDVENKHDSKNVVYSPLKHLMELVI